MAKAKAKAKKKVDLRIPAQVAQQGNWLLYTFVIDSRILDRLAWISRREEDKDEGYQRNLSPQRAADIAAYLDKDNGVLPNNIIVNFTDAVKYDKKTGELVIPDEEDIAFVIDGQHRMFGLRRAQASYDVIVTAFQSLSIAEQARQFKMINSKQRGVPSSLIYDLLDLTKDGTFVEQRGHELAGLLNEDPTSPWFKLIDMTSSGGGFISQTRVVTSLEPLVSERGSLYQYTAEEQFGILKNYFQAIKNVARNEWANKKSVLTKSLGFSALLILLPQVLNLTLLRFHDFRLASVSAVVQSLSQYDFSAERHKGWAGHPGENRLAGELANFLKTGESAAEEAAKIQL